MNEEPEVGGAASGEDNRVKDEVLSVKVWEMPVVITHWVAALAIFVLGITGYWMADPPFSEPGEASAVFTMGNIRFIHLAAGYFLLAAFLLRVYWGFVGNRFSRWSRMAPIKKVRWQAMWEEVEDLMLPHKRLHRFTGHAPLANASYIGLYLMIAFSLLTGFVLHAQAHYTPFWRYIGEWGMILFGGNLNTVRLLHNICLWLFAAFVLIHLYLVFLTVAVSRSTEIDTMISGKKLLLKGSISPYDEP